MSTSTCITTVEGYLEAKVWLTFTSLWYKQISFRAVSPNLKPSEVSHDDEFFKLHYTMKVFFWSLLAVVILCSSTSVQSQTTTVDKKQQQLQKLLSKVGVVVPEVNVRTDQPQTYRELKVRWGDSTKSTTELRPANNSEEQTPAPSLSVIEDKRRSGTLPRQRSLELSSTHIFIAAVDASNKLRWWSIILDPRVVRAETQTPTGELRGDNYYVSNVNFAVAFPDDPEIAQLRLYHPVWNGTEFDLKLLTVVSTR